MTLKDDLIRDEGLRLKPYHCTAGKLTIGVGRNIEDNGITRDEAMYLLINDINRVQDELAANLPWLKTCPQVVRDAFANLSFNMGWPRLSGFKKMIANAQAGLWGACADELLNSAYATQVGDRAKRIADQIRGPHV